MQNSNKVLKKSASTVPKTLSKAGYLSNYTQRKLHVTSPNVASCSLFQKEIATVTALALDCIKLNQNAKTPNFCDLSSIVICEDEKSSDGELVEFDKLLTSPIRKRDLQSIAKNGIKYGVKIPKTLTNSPNKNNFPSSLKFGFKSPQRQSNLSEKNKNINNKNKKIGK